MHERMRSSITESKILNLKHIIVPERLPERVPGLFDVAKEFTPEEWKRMADDVYDPKRWRKDLPIGKEIRWDFMYGETLIPFLVFLFGPEEQKKQLQDPYVGKWLKDITQQCLSDPGLWDDDHNLVRGLTAATQLKLFYQDSFPNALFTDSKLQKYQSMLEELDVHEEDVPAGYFWLSFLYPEKKLTAEISDYAVREYTEELTYPNPQNLPLRVPAVMKALGIAQDTIGEFVREYGEKVVEDFYSIKNDRQNKFYWDNVANRAFFLALLSADTIEISSKGLRIEQREKEKVAEARPSIPHVKKF